MYQQQFNEQFAAATRQFAETAARVNRLAIENAEQVFGLQIAAIEGNANATFAFWNQLTEARDFNGLRDVVPAGVQVTRENTERAIAAGQEIYDRTVKTNEAIAQIAKGEIEQVAAKAQAEAEKVVKTTAKKARR
ncbi:phasin family protein [Solilutibacter tolerans]|uniref:Phasin family protein n=1 Tax=Solilutibacter tolerans TaxID=1604334 RepID=A0A1N6Y5R2_9GAMM|nr:phasin family protein [Lysobacter tolerans]SIR09972.1 phasin family protein [Lysobacter tolerans]